MTLDHKATAIKDHIAALRDQSDYDFAREVQTRINVIIKIQHQMNSLQKTMTDAQTELKELQHQEFVVPACLTELL